MTRTAFAVVSALAPVMCFALLGLSSRPAMGAELVRVEYTVTGGEFTPSQFDPGLLTGAITGGSISWVAHAGGVSTPFSAAGTPLAGSITNFVLTGPDGTFSLLSPVKATFVQAGAAGFRFSATEFNGNRGGVSLVSDGVTFYAAGPGTFELFAAALRYGSLAGISSNVVGWGPGGSIRTHQFQVGNEVRTFIPEPASGAMLGLGLLGLGVAARVRRSRRV